MKYQVIGWTSNRSGDFLSLDKEDINDEVKEAISKEIRLHHYLFNSYDYENKESCVPVLNNYRKVILPKEEFALLFKSSFDYLKNIDISLFLDESLIDEKDKKYPAKIKTILERKDLFSKFKISQRLFASINSFFKQKEFNHQNIYLYPTSELKEYHFWINDRILFFNGHINEKIFGEIIKIFSFKDKNDFDNKIAEIKKMNPNIYFGYSLKEVEKYQNKEFVMLGFVKASAEDYLIDLDLLIRSSCDYNEFGCKFLLKQK